MEKKTILEILNIVKLDNSISLHVIFKYYFVKYKFKFMIAISILLLCPYISKFVSYQLSFLFEESKHFFMVVFSHINIKLSALIYCQLRVLWLINYGNKKYIPD